METKKVERKLESFKLFCYVDEDDGAFYLPMEIGHNFGMVESLIEEGAVSEFNQGIFHAMQQLLASPAALQMEKAMELIEDIIDDTEEEEEEANLPEEKDENMQVQDNEPEDTDLTDEQVEAELAAEEAYKANVVQRDASGRIIPAVEDDTVGPTHCNVDCG